MADSTDIEGFAAKIDSIQIRFMESLITGKRDSIFGDKDAGSAAKSGEESRTDEECLQRGTFEETFHPDNLFCRVNRD